MAHQLTL
jgi:gluconolactonase